MKIEFKKILANGVNFETTLGNVRFLGEAVKTSKALVKCTGEITGSVIHQCDRCADDFTLIVKEGVEVFASDGFYQSVEGEELLNIIEFFDGSIDIDTILQSEIEAFKSDYHYCGQCEQLKGE